MRAHVINQTDFAVGIAEGDEVFCTATGRAVGRHRLPANPWIEARESSIAGGDRPCKFPQSHARKEFVLLTGSRGNYLGANGKSRVGLELCGPSRLLFLRKRRADDEIS